ncbi:MAG: RHS repeat-associated core domain-containing protein [bacterium]
MFIRGVYIEGESGGTYDPFGRRIGKAVFGSLTGYIYDGEDVLAEVEEGNVVVSYVHGPGIDDLISMTRDGESYYYHADSLGSIVHLTNPDGESIASYSYDAFGALRDKIGDIPNPYLFTSREFDTESGLYFYRARYMDADVGRFITKDPILEPVVLQTLPVPFEDILEDTIDSSSPREDSREDRVELFFEN